MDVSISSFFDSSKCSLAINAEFTAGHSVAQVRNERFEHIGTHFTSDVFAGTPERPRMSSLVRPKTRCLQNCSEGNPCVPSGDTRKSFCFELMRFPGGENLALQILELICPSAAIQIFTF